MHKGARYSAAVVGASGYAGGELVRVLLGHPGFDLRLLAAGTKAGVPVTDIHPGLRAFDHEVFAETEPESLRDLDVVFLALPHGQSAAIAAQLPPDGPVVVDLGADHRLDRAEQWATYYGASEHAGSWVYGLPELPGVRTALAGARRVAVPGCYATAITLSLWPLVAQALVDESQLSVVAASGTSGAGRAASEALLATEVMGSMKAYKAGGVHQHTPEIEQALRAAGGTDPIVSFTPLLAPMPRGILATSSAPLAPGVGAQDLRAALVKAYADERFVRVLEPGVWPVTGATAGANTALLQVAADEHAGRAVVVTAIDNLQKGAAGQAIQCANIMLGLPRGRRPVRIGGCTVSVTAAKGFRAAGVAAGLKASGRPDVALVVNDGPLRTAAAVVTSNRIKAAPVLWTQQCLTTGELRAVALNSGGANACTGPEGFADTHHTAEHVAGLLGCGPIEVAVCSTGSDRGAPGHGPPLLAGFTECLAELSTEAGSAAAHAIMTTDTVAKTAIATDSISAVTVGGMAKGAGMLAPGMATMLSVITTDAICDSRTAQRILSRVTARTFNRVDSDGCMSTNDTVILMASGASGVQIDEGELHRTGHTMWPPVCPAC